MTAYNIISPTALASGQPEDITVVLSNFQAIANVVNGNLDDGNIKPAAAIAVSKLANYPALASQFLRGNGTWGVIAPADVAGLTPHIGGQSIVGTVDLPWPGGAAGPMTTLVPSTGGGALRTLGAPIYGQGARCVITSRASVGFTIIQAGSGAYASIALRRGYNVPLNAYESIELEYDGSWWNEVNRDRGIAAEVVGVVNGLGGIIAGIGFTVAHPSVGNYTITLTTGIAVPVAVVSPWGQSVVGGIAVNSSTQLAVFMTTPGAWTDSQFTFAVWNAA